MDGVSAVVVANVASTVFMAGMVWTIQTVHYPLMAQVGEGSFTTYMAAHRARITRLLALPWAVEGITSAWLVLAPPPGVPLWLALLGLALAGVGVLVTVAAAVPAHLVLDDGYDPATLRRLVAVNWVRTAAWTTHAVVALAIAAAAT